MEQDKRRVPPSRVKKGKSANKKEWGQTCVYLRHWTKRATVRQLEDNETGQDLSEFIEALLVAWLKGRGVVNPAWAEDGQRHEARS